MYAGNNSLVVF